ITPEGSLMNELEKIQGIYFKKDSNTNIEKNRQMISAIQKLKAKSKEEIFKDLFRGTSTFSIRQPQNYASITEAINNANNSMIWYRDNKYPDIARQICEYGISYCQYTYSLPKPLTEYFQLFMEVNYSEYFKALGFPGEFYDAATGTFYREAIENGINEITRNWKKKYAKLNFKTSNLKFDNLVNFNHSFTSQLAGLN